ncbi:LuxR C-terminal-related transcriptional regulator [Lichenihabitans sp. Uapishka_5]|uniref:LuxR C-terminal-related transcriptional regulator n=1 Tax=Lichenihabitans sp. Uapishka_5 TaxID=3037302 RepID=UPI0029E7E790|nr:LuxR C-terminal-related transcriptional regulator [Lichenihabitans sp. Uapishka_5]MDX7952548.1 LuxR C-terminal-related transcriptional regulator [Lichenihabitans sp. Uapishka_5]
MLTRIEEGLAGQVVSLQASAGFGKTEVLVSAFEQLRRPGDRFCWMSLDARDADKGIFLHDLAAAIRSAGRPSNAIAWKMVSRLAREEGEDAFATVGQLLASDAAPVTLFLDAVDAAGPTMGECLGTLPRRFPLNLRIVLASRGQPKIPLSTLRARGLLLELGARDLAFSGQETVDLCAGVLSREDAGRLHATTGGWPALVILGRMAVVGADGSGERPGLLSGSHPLFRDFVEEEVLGDLPPEWSRALEICAILDSVPLDLVAHLSGVAVDGAVLSAMERLSPIVEMSPHPHRRLRIHPVVRLSLQARASLRPMGEVAALHVHAASWFAERGILDLAVRHAAQGGDFPLAVEAIRRAGGVNIFLRAGYSTLTRLLADLPAPVVQQSSVLRLSHALVLAKQGQIQLAREVVDGLKAIGPGSDTIPSADLEHIDGMIDIYEDRNLGDEQIARLRRASQDFATYDNWERGWIYNHLCIAHQRSGDLRAARYTGLRALTCYREERTPYAQIFMMAHVGTVLMASGRLAAALKLLRDADTLVRDTHGSDANIAALVQIPLATCLYHQGDLAKASALLDDALPIVKRGEGWVDAFARGYATLARAKFLREGLEAGLAVLDEAEVLAVERVLPRLESSIALTRAELLTRGGLLDAALHVLEPLPAIALTDCLAKRWPTLRERHEALATKARLLVRRGEPDEGLALARHLLSSAGSTDMGLDLLSARLVMIEGLWGTRCHEEALSQIQAVLAFAVPQQATQVVRDGDASMKGILRAVVRQFGLSVFRPEGVAYLASILGPLQPRRVGELTSSAAVVLTMREAEVLAGLERGAANKEIARELRLTEAAVKFHLKNLFRKLGVNRRTLALSVARQMKLVAAQGSAQIDGE